SFSTEYSGRSFMEAYHVFTLKHRSRSDFSGNNLSFAVLAGFQEGRQMVVYAGNFRDSSQTVNVTVNGRTWGTKLASEGIKQKSFPVAEKYRVNFSGQQFSTSFDAVGHSFYAVSYRYETANAVRQDTYTG
ncbi:MAG: hypothetical protein ABEJ98_05430, partial [Candidatus Nanohaloarchaea archaeon]